MIFQSNNYGLRAGGVAGGAGIGAFADHVIASERARGLSLRIGHLARPVSATIKTPGSASVLSRVFGRRATLLERLGLPSRRDRAFEEFGRAADPRGLPAEFAWARDVTERVTALVASVRA